PRARKRETGEPTNGQSPRSLVPRHSAVAKSGGFAVAFAARRAYGRPALSNPGAAAPQKASHMDLYGILRRNGWASPEDLQAAAARSTEEGDKADSGVRWIRSYVIEEESGELGTFCVYEADNPEAIRAHAAAADLPADEMM